MDYNPILLLFISCSNYFIFGHWKSFLVGPYVFLICCHWFLSTSLLFLASQDAPESPFIFPAPPLELTTSPKKELKSNQIKAYSINTKHRKKLKT